MKLKILFFYCSLLMLLTACNKKAYLFTSFHEPANEGLRMLYSYDGYKWNDFDTIFLKPTVGNQKVMRDPSLLQDKNGNFHLVWTSSWRGDLGFGYATSKDLLHWSNQQFLPVMQSQPSTVNVWAPELLYSDIDNNCKIIWASCIPGLYEKGLEADSNNHRMYITSTNDFEIFDKTTLFFNPGYSVIDATVIKRNNNDYVMVFKDNTRPERNLKVAFANNPTGPWTNISKPFTDKFTEGPTVLKVKNKWIIYFDSYDKGIYEAVETTDFVNFKNITEQVVVPKGHKHGTIVTVSRKFVNQLKKNLGK